MLVGRVPRVPCCCFGFQAVFWLSIWSEQSLLVGWWRLACLHLIGSPVRQPHVSKRELLFRITFAVILELLSGNWLARLGITTVMIWTWHVVMCVMRRRRGHWLKLSSPFVSFLQRVFVRFHIFMAGCYRCVLILGFLVSAIMRCLSTALLIALAAAQDPAEGWMAYAMSSLPSSVERITRLEMGFLLAVVRHGSRRQSQLDSASEPLERKCVVDVHRVLSVVSRAQQQFPELHGAGRTDTPRRVGVQLRTIRTPSARRLWRQARRALRSFSASLGKKFVVPYVVYERVFSCYTYPGDGKVSFQNINVECDGTDCTLLQHTPRLGPYHRFSLLRQQPWSPLQVPWWFLLQRCRVLCAFQPSAQHLLLSRLRHQWQLSHRV